MPIAICEHSVTKDANSIEMSVSIKLFGKQKTEIIKIKINE